MAMLITHFHKLIQSKVIWYFILGIIIISFVVMFTPTMRGSSQKQRPQDAGELFGKKISQDQYRTAYQNAYAWQILTSGRMLKMTPELTAALREDAWQRLAALHKAEAEQVVVTDQDVVKQMRAMPVFQGENGVYNDNLRRAIFQQIGLNPAQSEELIREQIVIYRLMSRPAQAALISPEELKKAYHLYTDRFTLKYVVVPSSMVEKSVTVSKEDAQALYNENPEAFRMEAKVRVSYVEFPAGDFMSEVVIPDGAALDAYNNNIERFRIETTNVTDVAQYKPFETVEAEITSQIKKQMALKLAAEKATAFVVKVAPNAERDQPDFVGAAAGEGLKIKTLPAFGVRDDLPGIDAPVPFRQAAFRLENDAYASFSDAIVGKDSVYVLSLEQRYSSFIPPFDSVETAAMDAARKKAVVSALAARALELEKSLKAAIDAGTDFDAAAKTFNLTAKTTPEFDLQTSLDDPYADTLVRGCLNVQQNEFCEPAAVDGGVLLTYVVARKSVDMDVGLPAVRDELMGMLERDRADRLAAVWRASLLTEAKFKNLMKPAAAQ